MAHDVVHDRTLTSPEQSVMFFLFACMFSMVHGNQQMYAYLIDQITTQFGVTEKWATDLGFVSWLTYFLGGFTFGLVNTAVCYMWPEAKHLRWRKGVVFTSIALAFTLWSICVAVVAWETLTKELFSAMVGTYSFGGGFFALGGMYHVVVEIQALEKSMMKNAILVCVLGLSIFYLLVTMIYHLSYNIDPTPGAPYDPASQYRFQNAYAHLVLPALIFVAAFLGSATLYASSFCNTDAKVEARKAELVNGVKNLPNPLVAVGATFRGVGEVAKDVGEFAGGIIDPSGKNKVFVARGCSGSLREVASYVMFVLSSFLFSFAMTASYIFIPLYLNRTGIPNMMRDGSIIAIALSLVAVVLYACMIEHLDAAIGGFSIGRNALAVGVLGAASIASMFVLYAVAIGASPATYGAFMTIMAFLHMGLMPILIDYLYHASIYYNHTNLGMPVQAMAYAIMLLLISLGPLIGWSDLVTGSLVDLGGVPVIDPSKTTVWIAAVYTSAMGLNMASRYFKHDGKMPEYTRMADDRPGDA